MRESQGKALASLKNKRILGGALHGFCHPTMAHQRLNSELTSADTSFLGWSRNVYTTGWLMQDPKQSVLGICCCPFLGLTGKMFWMILPMSFHGFTLEKVKQSSNFEWVGSLKRLINFNRNASSAKYGLFVLPDWLTCQHSQPQSLLQPLSNLNYIPDFHPDPFYSLRCGILSVRWKADPRHYSSCSWYQSNSYSSTGDVTGSIPLLLHHAWEPCRPGSPIHSSSPPQDTGLHPAFLQLTLNWLWDF